MANRAGTHNDVSAPPSEFLVVGIGASAGGVEALREFFEQVPTDSNCAYVVILHLSPEHDSQLAAILQAVTLIPVMPVTERVRVEANHIYVVSPNQHLTMVDGEIMVSQNLRLEDRRAPVDMFFRTLAETHDSRAVCVVLSGTGADGSMGLKRIKERGGVVFVQDPNEATFNEMPRSAIATDLIDEVLPVAAIPARIIAYRAGLGIIAIPVEADQRPEAQQQALREIFAQLRLRTGHDFSNYKRPTLLRRIERRINVRSLPDLPAYAAMLRDNPDEAQALLKDLLISVTNFFRDPAAYAALAQDILPRIFQGRHSGEQVRIWVVGCATGEETYSIAMLCAEYVTDALDTPGIQIFASDIDDAAIAQAREGLYTANDTADVSPERLRRFFIKEDDHYRVRRELREMILFANHNALKDPPFSHLDLVTCRNMLIYLNQVAQERVLKTLHFALNPGGYLFLGTSEAVDGASDLFATVNREQHIFQHRSTPTRSLPVPESVPTVHIEQPRAGPRVVEVDERMRERISYGDLHLRLLEEYAPPSIVVNEDYDIVHLSERAGHYLQIIGGEPSINLLTLIRPELRVDLRTALYHAMQRQANVDTRTLSIRVGDRTETVTIHVRPVLRPDDSARGFLLVLFEPGTNSASDGTLVVHSDTPVTQQLEEEVLRLKIQLRTSSEQYELQAEELRTTNEELLALNEELRSSTEELETNREELQSINEELRTVNQELKVKVEEATQTSANLQNLVNSTAIGTIFLDRSLRVKLFTPAARELFNLIPADYGRPLSDITHRLIDVDVLADAETVLARLHTIEREAHTTDQRVVVLRILPYRAAEDRIGGVVITFFDITERGRVEAALRQRESQYTLLVESLPDVVFRLDRNLRHLYISPIIESITGIPSAAWLGKTGREMGLPREACDLFEERSREALATGRETHLEFEFQGRYFRNRIIPEHDVDGAINSLMGITEDITERKHREANLAFLAEVGADFAPRASGDELMQRVGDRLARYLNLSRCDFSVVDEAADRITTIYDWRRDESLPSVLGEHNISTFLSEAGRQQYAAGSLTVVNDTGASPLLSESHEIFKQLGIGAVVDVPYLEQGRWKFLLSACRGRPSAWRDDEIELIRELTARIYIRLERARAEEILRESEARFRTLADAVPQLIWTNDGAGRANYFNQRWFDYSGLSYEESAGWGWQAIVHPDDAAASIERWQQALAASEVFETEYRLRRADGAYRWHLGRNVPLHDQHDRVMGWFGSATDIEDLKQAEAARHESAVLRQLAAAQEEERLRIARDLHDQMGQQITGLLLGLKQLEQPAQGTPLAELLPPLQALAFDLAKETHRLAVNLRPTVLEDVGLVPALEQLLSDWSAQTQIEAVFHSQGMDQVRLPRAIEVALYRIVQEALTNVRKHAAATLVGVIVERRGDQVIVIVEDNGHGYDVDQAPPTNGRPRLGVLGMRERATQVGGILEIESSPGSGTTMLARVPLDIHQPNL